MKIAPRDIASLLKRPDPRFLVFFLYGQDQGLARERSIGLAHLFADNLDDPFAVTRLTGNNFLTILHCCVMKWTHCQHSAVFGLLW